MIRATSNRCRTVATSAQTSRPAMATKIAIAKLAIADMYITPHTDRTGIAFATFITTTASVGGAERPDSKLLWPAARVILCLEPSLGSPRQRFTQWTWVAGFDGMNATIA